MRSHQRTGSALWETWKDPEPPHDIVRSSCMVITEPNAFVVQYHDRMPVVLTGGDVMDWLTGAKGLELLKPATDDALNAWPVSRKVNSSKGGSLRGPFINAGGEFDRRTTFGPSRGPSSA